MMNKFFIKAKNLEIGGPSMSNSLKFVAAIFTTLFITSQSMAAMPSRVVIVGTVESVSEKIVTIKTKTGAVKVPRKNLVDKHKVSFGDEVRAEVTLAALKQLNG